MSSIYRKGRDGYYYYQTYVINPATGKKDKRIFHSLSTKDPEEAKKQKNILDKKYDKQSPLGSYFPKLKYNSGLKQSFVLILCSVAITTLLIEYFRPKTVKTKPVNKTLTQNIDRTTSKINKPVKALNSEKTDSIIGFKPKNHQQQKQDVATNVIIPEYTVEKVDVLSDAFKQGKVYVTINKNSSKESQLLLCEELAKRYKEFSNIVVCLYSNDPAGKELALGNDELVSVEDYKRSWLAMYTYNTVEGEYFDDNPSGYLGIY